MSFSDKIIFWYQSNHRDLPWRRTQDPYLIWLSEIILQQTRVDQGLPYYLKFTEHFPTVYDLASANEDTVLKLWQGLGYYSRARNLHAAAKYVVTELGGVFPTSSGELIKLKGVGEYTSAAIASFSSKEQIAVVDGNVMRVLSRYYGISDPIDEKEGKTRISELANELIPSHQPDTHNQAIMEFGALQCTPKATDCQQCPLIDSCYAYANDLVGGLPIKAKKTKQRDRFFNFIVMNSGKEILLEKRTGKGIWQNLYQFPLIESKKNLATPADLLKALESNADFTYKSEVVKHVLSHQILYCTFWEFQTESLETAKDQIIVAHNDLGEYGVPRVVENYMDSSGFQERLSLNLK